MPVIRLPILMIVAVAMAVACSSGNDDDAGANDDAQPTEQRRAGDSETDSPAEETEEASPTPTLDPEAENALAQSLLLSVNDFPTGWSETPADEEEDTPADECDPGVAPGRTGTAKTGDFSDGLSGEIDQEVAVFATPESAVASLARLQDTANCIVDVINDGKFDTSEAEASNAKFGALSFPGFGDASDAYRIEFHVKAKGQSGLGTEGTVYLDVVRVIEGRTGFALRASDTFSPFDTTMLETMVQKAYDKLESAEQ